MPTIMVVDDSDLTRLTLMRILRREGYSTVSASNGRDALNALRHQVPDLILLDLGMPELNGLEVLESLHNQPRFQDIPVVMLTGTSDTHAVHRAEQLGAKRYMVKAAFSVEEMLGVVKQYTNYLPH